jgi:hypothetical protein
MEETRRMKDEAARIARQQEFEEEQRLEVIMFFVLILMFLIYALTAAGT